MTSTANTPPLVLLVEDDEAVQIVLETALHDEGLLVTAPNGARAIAELEAEEMTFNALITDIKLGAGPSGWDVGRRARELASGLPVIYISGDSAYEWSANGVPGSIMLQKPFVIAQLVTALTTLLNQASTAAALTNSVSADVIKFA